MSIEAPGLRKRLAAFKPLDSSPVSELRVLRTEKGKGDDEERGEEERIHESPSEMLNESMLRSLSSISSEHSSGSVEDDSEREHIDESGTTKGGAGKGHTVAENGRDKVPKPSPKPGMTQTSSPGASRNPPRVVRRGTSTYSDARRTSGSSGSSGGAWLGYDLSIIVALVSPIGNILTGSDHIKNILLLLFLIYYLHQLVEVPWTLYRMSIPSGDSFTSMPDADPAKLAAYTELRHLEIFYLVLTVLSPFVGATLLKLVATAISGDPSTLSWFSTLLFVLATGIRPWSHLTDRLKDRSQALNALIEEPVADESAMQDDEDPQAKIDQGLSDLREKYDSLDKRLTDLDVSGTRELDDLADAIDAVETGVRKYQNDSNKKAQEWDARLGVLETYVLDLHRKDRQTRIHEKETHMRGARLRALFWEALALPWTVFAFTWDFASKIVRRGVSPAGPASVDVVKDKPISPTSSRFRSHVLETIVEEDPDAQDGAPQNGFVASDSSQTLVAEPVKSRRQDDIAEFGANVVFRFFTIVFAPALLLARAFSFLLDLPRSVVRAIVH